MMTAEAARGVNTPGRVAQAVFAAVAAHDPDAIVRHAAANVHDDFVAVREMHGREEVRRFFAEVFAAFPDFTITVDRIVGDERIAVVQWHAVGTFTGEPFLGMIATGRRASLKGVDVIDVDAGLVQRNTIYYDGATMARQLGLLPKKDGFTDHALLTLFNLRTRGAGLLRRARQFRRPNRHVVA